MFYYGGIFSPQVLLLLLAAGLYAVHAHGDAAQGNIRDSSAAILSPTNRTTSPSNLNKMLFIDNAYGRATLVSLDGASESCDLEIYPVQWPAAITYSDQEGVVLACGGDNLEDADRCWQFDGSTWSPLPNSGLKHCTDGVPNVMVTGEGWWVTGELSADYTCSVTTTEIYTGEDWVPGPALPGNSNLEYACMVNLNTTHTMITGGFKRGYDVNVNVNVNDVWLYDWTAQAWTKTGSLNQARYEHGCVSLGDQGVVALGGYDGSTPLYTVELYDPATGTWSSQSDLPQVLNPWAPLLLNWNDQVIALFADSDQIYQWSKENGEWSVLEDVKLPEEFFGYPNDRAILVPDDFAQSCK